MNWFLLRSQHPVNFLPSLLFGLCQDSAHRSNMHMLRSPQATRTWPTTLCSTPLTIIMNDSCHLFCPHNCIQNDSAVHTTCCSIGLRSGCSPPCPLFTLAYRQSGSDCRCHTCEALCQGNAVAGSPLCCQELSPGGSNILYSNKLANGYFIFQVLFCVSHLV
jgi:hypothetical protein